MVVRDPGPLVGPGFRPHLLRPRSGRIAPVLPSIAEFLPSLESVGGAAMHRPPHLDRYEPALPLRSTPSAPGLGVTYDLL